MSGTKRHAEKIRIPLMPYSKVRLKQIFPDGIYTYRYMPEEAQVVMSETTLPEYENGENMFGVNINSENGRYVGIAYLVFSESGYLEIEFRPRSAFSGNGGVQKYINFLRKGVEELKPFLKVFEKHRII